MIQAGEQDAGHWRPGLLSKVLSSPGRGRVNRLGREQPHPTSWPTGTTGGGKRGETRCLGSSELGKLSPERLVGQA